MLYPFDKKYRGKIIAGTYCSGTVDHFKMAVDLEIIVLRDEKF
jgi:hypothetical protein